MLRQSLLLPALVPALLMGGCMGTQNRGLESVHQPVVARADYLLDLRTTGYSLAPGESARLNAWLATMRLRYGDKVAVDDPSGYRGVRDDVARVVATFGLLVGDEHPATTVPAAPGSVRVIVSRMQASVPGCPDWARDSSVEYNSNTSSNYGCATNASLAAMIARPEDLIHGEGQSGADPVRAAKAIDALNKGALSGSSGAAASSSGGASSSSSTSGGGTK